MFASWIVSSFISATVTTAEFASISGVEVTVSPSNDRLAVLEVALAVSGGVTNFTAVRIWHNDQGPLPAICLDCTSLVTQDYPSSRVDTLYVTVVVLSPIQFSIGDILRLEIEYTVGASVKSVSGVFRILSL
ncbi:MAG: hypothetical protein QXH21_08830 [Ignisphaera sp.]